MVEGHPEVARLSRALPDGALQLPPPLQVRDTRAGSVARVRSARHVHRYSELTGWVWAAPERVHARGVASCA